VDPYTFPHSSSGQICSTFTWWLSTWSLKCVFCLLTFPQLRHFHAFWPSSKCVRVKWESTSCWIVCFSLKYCSLGPEINQTHCTFTQIYFYFYRYKSLILLFWSFIMWSDVHSQGWLRSAGFSTFYIWTRVLKLKMMSFNVIFHMVFLLTEFVTVKATITFLSIIKKCSFHLVF